MKSGNRSGNWKQNDRFRGHPYGGGRQHAFGDDDRRHRFRPGKQFYKFKHARDDVQLRERNHIDVVVPLHEPDYYESLVVPKCPHGLCLLFKQPRTDGEGFDRWFGCALHRSVDACPFRSPWPEGDVVEPVKRGHLMKIPHRVNVTQKLAEMRKKKAKSFYFCKPCIDVFPDDKHFHSVEGPLDINSDPFSLIPAIQADSTQAQYWFKDECLELLLKSLKAAGRKEFICIGTPQFFQFLIKRNETAYLLDIDERFRTFFDGSQFAMYNMMNNEFHCSEEGFTQFIRKARAPVVVIDPPFGAFIKPLVASVKELVKESPKGAHYVIAMPYFMDRHLLREMPDLRALDYAVTYSNHPKFKSVYTSPVRFFTTVNRKFFVLDDDEDYKYCEACKFYVSKENRHCNTCGTCASRDGRDTRHCFTCQRCVPAKYTHCSRCNVCTLQNRCHVK